MKTAIGICNYNRAEDVCRAVAAALAQTREPAAILVLDNASSDDSVERLSARFGSRISIRREAANHGGAGGFSLLSRTLSQTDAETIILLDSDAFLAPDAVEAMIEGLQSAPDVGVVGARIMHEHAPTRIQECGARIDWDKASFTLNRGNQELSSSTPLPPYEEVDYVPACALAARKSVFQNIGHFDPSYFIYFDDIEWCHRARQRGYSIRVANHAVALHKGGGKRKTSHFSTYYYWRNRFRFFFENADNPTGTLDYLVENAARAIATSQALQQPHAAQIVRRAALDAARKDWGRKDIPARSLELDPPSPFHVAAIPPECQTRAVDHIFDPCSEELDSTLLFDPFGKRISAGAARTLAPRFKHEKQMAKTELQAAFARLTLS